MTGRRQDGFQPRPRKKVSDVTIPMTLVLPQMPNYLGVVGMTDNISVGHLTPEQAEALAEAWKQAFLEHCAQRRASLKKPEHDGRGPG